MVSKKNLEEKLVKMERELTALQAENIFLEGECKEMAKSLSVLAKTCHSIYKCYPYVLSECCTEPNLIKLFKIQDAFHKFLQNLMKYSDNPEQEEEGGKDEI